VAHYCKSLQDEWKGLLACVALYNDRISVQRIDLTHTFSASHEEFEFYELKGALGRMLFGDTSFWSDPNAVHNRSPFLQAIYFNTVVKARPTKILVGSTSPYSILFSPPIIPDGEHVPFCNDETKRFINPLTVELTPNQVQLLYDYVRFVRSRIANFGTQINRGRPDNSRVAIDRLSEFLLKFMGEIETYAGRMQHLPAYDKFSLNRDNLISTEPLFQSPFASILNAESNVYVSTEGLFYLEEVAGSRLLSMNDLLLDPAHPLVEVGFSSDENPGDCAAYLLKAKEGRYFALPITREGLRVFQSNLGEMIANPDKTEGGFSAEWVGGIHHEIRVTLQLKVRRDALGNDVIRVDTTKVYRTKQILSQRIAAWPNFVTDEIWTNYSLYSELPHNAREGVKAWPLLWDSKSQKIKEYENGEFVYACQEVSAPGERGARYAEIVVPQFDNPNPGLQYEIYKSKIPIIGVELRVGSGVEAPLGGYLIGRIGNSPSKGYTKILGQSIGRMTPVTVGFDMGSNNTCISYCTSQGSPQLVHFKNRRVMLLGSEIVDPENVMDARASELFFFQKEEPLGKFRSMMMVHEDARLANATQDVEQVIMGGFPVFAQNIPVIKLNPANPNHDYFIAVNGEEAILKFNMKWADSGQKRENGYKQGFVKLVWLMVNAELLYNGYYPTKLSWAYPFAMRDGVYQEYSGMWSNLHKVLNLGTGYEFTRDHLTESEAVAEFITNSRLGGLAPSRQDLSIGFDIGGSTTDILFLVQKGQHDYLLRQSSLLMAAGMVTRMAQQSFSIREALGSFIQNRSIPLHIPALVQAGTHGALNPDTGPFFFNTVLDRLTESQLEQLYGHLYISGGKGIFVPIAFVTGMLMFYAGQVSQSIMQQPEYQHLTDVRMGFFGKGGNIFTWVMSVLNRQNKGRRYLEECFFLGMEVIREEEARAKAASATPQNPVHTSGVPSNKRAILSSTFMTNAETNKTEVAHGLAGGRRLLSAESVENRKDLVGEQGFTWLGTGVLKAQTAMKPEYLQHLGEQFDIPIEFPNLARFVDLYADFINSESPVIATMVREKVKRMSGLRKFIQDLPQYKEAQSVTGAGFDFMSPMVILGGMYLLETYIMPNCLDRK
jgi:hypothetical protein